MRNLVFVVIMLGATSMNFCKVMLAAAFLSPPQLAYYASVIGLAGLSGMVVSFGRVETTTKLYPRLWAAGHVYEPIWDAFKTAAVIGSWVGLLLVVAVVLRLFGYIEVGLFGLAIFAVLVWNSVLQALCAALARGTGSVLLICAFSIVRGAVPLVAVSAILTYDDWQVAVLAETLAATIVVAVSALLILRTVRRHVHRAEVQSRPVPDRDAKSGRTLYVANLLSSSISIGDRAVVTGLAGPATGGAYAAISLVPQAGALLAGILSQKTGPDAIRAMYNGLGVRDVLRSLRAPAALMLVASIFVALTLLIAPYVSERADLYLVERGIRATTVILSVILFSLQFVLALEFVLIAADDEKSIVVSSLLAFLTFLICIFITYDSGFGLDGYIASGVVARLVQTMSLLKSIAGMRD